MAKKDITRSLAEIMELPQLRAKEMLQKTLDLLIDTLVQEGRIELRNFGVFQIRKRDARLGRNPRTGAKVSVPAKSVVTFKPGREMELRVQMLDRDVAAHQASDEEIYSEMDDANEEEESDNAE